MRQGQSLPTRYRLQSRQCVRIHCCLVEVTSSVKIVTSPHHTQRRKSQVTCCHLKSQARVERRNRDAWVFAIMPLLVAGLRDRTVTMSVDRSTGRRENRFLEGENWVHTIENAPDEQLHSCASPRLSDLPQMA